MSPAGEAAGSQVKGAVGAVPAEDAVPAAAAPPLRVLADRGSCCGAGMCVLNAPDVFDQDPDDGLVVLLDPDPPAELHRAVRDAVRLCPSGAIRIAKD